MTDSSKKTVMRNPVLAGLVSLALILDAGSTAAQSESVGLDSGGLRTPRYPDVPEPQEQPERPALKEPESLPDGSDLPGARAPFVRNAGIAVTRIDVVGNTILDERDIDQLVSAYEGRVMTSEELQQLRHELSALYLNAGYVNSGAIIPNQQVKDGIVTLQVIEGRLTRINVDGTDRLSPDYVAQRIERDISVPLDVTQLQTNLVLLQRDPMIRSVNAELLPGGPPGQDYLNVRVEENPPLQVSLVADNYRPPSTGEHQGTAYANYRSLLTSGDRLAGMFSLSEGTDEYGLSYTLPVFASRANLEFYGNTNVSDVVEAEFDDLDIETEIDTYGVFFSYPFVQRLNRSATGKLGLEHKDSKNEVLGVPFSLSAGDVDGKAKGTSLYFGVETLAQGDRQVITTRWTIQVGIDALDSTVSNDDVPDSEFVAMIGQVQYLRQFLWRQSRLSFRTTFQVVDDPLLGMYKLGIGGRYGVRGYRDNTLVRDNGLVAQLEYQVPVFVDEGGRDKYGFRLAVFGDYGISENVGYASFNSDSDDIYSAGVGAIWEPTSWLYGEIYWGADLKDRDTPDDSLADDGIHYQVRLQKSF